MGPGGTGPPPPGLAVLLGLERRAGPGAAALALHVAYITGHIPSDLDLRVDAALDADPDLNVSLDPDDAACCALYRCPLITSLLFLLPAPFFRY